MQGIPINHKRARIRQALLLSLIDRYRYEFFCGHLGGVPEAVFYKIER